MNLRAVEPITEADLLGIELQELLESQAIEILGVDRTFIDGWHINRIREDGAIDAYVPLGRIETTNVPTDPINIKTLKDLFDEREREVGGTGQRDPVVLGYVPGDALYMIDGFHRHEVQILRGQEILHATIEPNLTYEEVIKRRLEYARTHTEIEFARQVEWMQSVWERTPWSGMVPNVLTAFRAFQDDYGHGGTDDIKQIDALSDNDYKSIRAWVATQSKEWGYTPKEIRDNLAKAESFDKDLMLLVYQRPGKVPDGRIGLGHVQAIIDVYGGEFDLQKAVVDIVTRERLSVPQTILLIDQVEEGGPRSPEDIERLAEAVDFLQLKKEKAKGAVRSIGSASVRGIEISDEFSHSEALDQFMAMIPALRSVALEKGQWTRADINVAQKISKELNAILTKLLSVPANGAVSSPHITDSLAATSRATTVSHASAPSPEAPPPDAVQQEFMDYLSGKSEDAPLLVTRREVFAAQKALRRDTSANLIRREKLEEEIRETLRNLPG